MCVQQQMDATPFDKAQDRLHGITNNPNRGDDPEYIVRLIKQVVTVSIETVKIVKGLQGLDIQLDEKS